MKKILVNLSLVLVTAAAAAAIGSQLPRLINEVRGGSTVRGDFAIHVAQQAPKLTLYGTTTCPFCKKARDYLTAAGIPYNEKLIDKDKASGELYDKLNQNSVPLLVSATEMVVGFDQSAYDRLAKASAGK